MEALEQPPRPGDEVALISPSDKHDDGINQAGPSLALLPSALESSMLYPFTAVVLNITAALLLIGINTTHVYFSDLPGSKTAETWYVVGTTVTATALSMFSLGQIKRLLIRALQKESVSSAVRRRNGVLTGLGTAMDQLHLWPTTLALMTAGLTTTGLVTGLSLNRVDRVTPTTTTIWHYRNLSTEEGAKCFIEPTSSLASLPGMWFNWTTGPGQRLGIRGNFMDEHIEFRVVSDSMDYKCETFYVLPAFLAAPDLGSAYPYTLDGVPVSRHAAGIPFSTDNAGFFHSFGVFGESRLINLAAFQQAEQCLPIMASNPVRCEERGTVGVSRRNQTINVTSEDTGFWVRSPQFRFDPALQAATVLGVNTHNHSVGKATIFLGSTREQAFKMRLFVNSTQPGADNVAITCAVDIAPSVAFRTVKLSRVVNNGTLGVSDKAYHITSDPESPDCVPLSTVDGGVVRLADILTPTALATAAGASWQLLAEHLFDDGWPDSLGRVAAKLGLSSSHEMMFRESRNGLEDALGLASAIALGYYYGTDNHVTSDSGLQLRGGTVTYSTIRVGPGDWTVLACLLPLVFVAGYISVLMWRTTQSTASTRLSSRYHKSHHKLGVRT